MPDEYPNFAALTAAEREGVDFERVVRSQPNAKVALLAPHGGRIEPYTDSIAATIAVNDFSLYCFRSKKPKNKGNLHITSHNFDDPKCIGMASRHRWVLAIHGCNKEGHRVLLGGRDTELIADLAQSLQAAGIAAETSGHEYSGSHPNNVCNRSATGVGAQFELSMPFRRSPSKMLFVEIVRTVLLRKQNSS